MKKILLTLFLAGFFGFVTNIHADSSPWRPRNKKCYMLSEGNLVTVKTKKNRVVKKRYVNGDKREETTTYADGRIEHKFY